MKGQETMLTEAGLLGSWDFKIRGLLYWLVQSGKAS